jgi:protein-S-isoprenylcysteine O-methyltransferase Ste14
MWWFLIPLVLGFTLNAASAFTAACSRRWGQRGGQAASFVLRNVLGIPLWVAGFVLAIRTPSPAIVSPDRALQVGAWLLVAAGGALILSALRTLGRRATSPSTRDTLVAGEAYSHVRHPIHVGTFLEFVGLWLLFATTPVLAACALGIAWLAIQSRLEEADLLERVPGYRAYMARTTAFVPRFWRRRSSRGAQTHRQG